MSMSFGEVVYPSSRAFWTEEDDENDNQSTENLTKLFTVEWSEDIPQQINTLIVIETSLIVDFMKDYVSKNAKEVCQIKSSSSKHPSKLYKASNNSFICLVSPDVELAQAGDFVDTASEILKKAKNIIAITSSHITQLKNIENRNISTYLISLYTRKATNDVKNSISMPKQPSIVPGVGAGVVAYAEVMDQSASLNILYLDGYELDSNSASPLTKLFAEVTKHELPELKCGKPFIFNKGNLYMYSNIFYYQHRHINMAT
ncbi:uncharacterized protein PSMG1 [Chelonus insularis]|uniref:uncharacterized protein PSMG1 n=1 Tax=Chelonus insularis TaxID=460826 RepID=UPI00158AFFD4|nr:uncharacterized protein LOC118071341 [Chelonus insularis]